MYCIILLNNGPFNMITNALPSIKNVPPIAKETRKISTDLTNKVNIFISYHIRNMTSWRNGSASDSRSEGCVFESRRGQIYYRMFFSHIMYKHYVCLAVFILFR